MQRDNDTLWSSPAHVHEYFGGRCHTFRPPGTTKTGETNSLLIGLLDPTPSATKLSIFLHSPGAFAYNKSPKFFGRSVIHPEFERHKKYVISKKRYKRLSREGDLCSVDLDSEGWIGCAEEAYDRMAGGCKMPWKTEEMEK